MNVTLVIVQVNPHGTDTVYVHTDLPTPFEAQVVDAPYTVMKFETPRRKGAAFALENFPRSATVHLIDTTNPDNLLQVLRP